MRLSPDINSDSNELKIDANGIGCGGDMSISGEIMNEYFRNFGLIFSQLEGARCGDIWLRRFCYENMGRLIVRMGEMMGRFEVEQGRCPLCVLGVYIDLNGHKDLVSRVMDWVRKLEGVDDVLEDGGMVACEGEGMVVGLYHNLCVYRGMVQRVCRMMSRPTDEMLRGLYGEVDNRMVSCWDLHEEVDSRIALRRSKTLDSAPTNDEVKRWEDEMFEGLEKENLGRLRGVLERVYSTREEREVEVGRFIYSQYDVDCGGEDVVDKVEGRLRRIMEVVYGYECYEHLRNKDVAMSINETSMEELSVVVELLNTIPSKNVNGKFTQEMIVRLWSQFLNSPLHSHFVKRSKTGYKNINVRFVCVLLGRSLYHSVYVNTNPTAMANGLSKVYGGSVNNMRSYISRGQGMSDETQDTITQVDEIFRSVLVG